MSLAFRLGCGVIASAGLVFASSVYGQTSTDSFGSGANQFNIDFVTIPGSAGDGYGGQSAGFFTTTNISHDYRMGVYEITNDQWDKFKNEYGTVNGSPYSAYDESPTYTGADVPTNEVSWYEAAQFVNWLNTSSGHQAAYKFTGTQGTLGYTLDTWSAAEADNGTNLYRHKDAFYYLPNENEWVKAAYWNGTNLQTYATPDDTVPVEDVEANYERDSPSEPWDVGSGAEELNGTFDMMGNDLEWMESPYYAGDYGTGSRRGLRGGSVISDVSDLASSYRFGIYPNGEGFGIGFRVASEVPEPASLSLLAVGTLALLRRR